MDNELNTFMIHSCDATCRPKTPGTLITLKNAGETGDMWMIPLFSGVYVSFNDLHMHTIPVMQSSCARRMLINYCEEGRCEVNLGDAGYVFVDKGLLSIDTHTVKHDFKSPTGRYKGTELFIDFSALQQDNPPVFETMDIDIRQIRAKFCPDDESFLARAPDTITQIFRKMAECSSSLTLLRLSVLRLLYELSVLVKGEMAVKNSFLTRGQAEIAKRTYQIVTDRLSHKYSVSEIADSFGISETSLRNYFQQVYGESIPSLIRRKRMEQAAAVLVNTDKAITEIALLAGYENQSKFSAAFKRYYGDSPMEYRRMERLNTKGEHWDD